MDKHKILFIVYHGFAEHSGISKKIHYQLKGLRENGHEVHVCTYDIAPSGDRIRYVDGEVLQNFGKGRLASLRKRMCYDSIVDYVRTNHIDVVYTRSFHNANPFTIRMFRRLRQAGVRTAIEIPTYPYDQEYNGFPLSERLQLKVDQLFRHKLACQTDAIVTFSKDEQIFGRRTIRISNGVDFDSIALWRPTPHAMPNEFHLIGVAEVHYWHGFDRLIQGLGEYYKQPRETKVYFHIVGGIGPSEMYNSKHATGFHELIEQYGLQPYVIFHGTKFGQELDDCFNQCDFAVGSLARHRSGVQSIKTLKNREYAARGIPFIFSEDDEDFNDRPYIMKVPANESPVNIESILRFNESLNMDARTIRGSIQPLSWRMQMQKVIDEL